MHFLRAQISASEAKWLVVSPWWLRNAPFSQGHYSVKTDGSLSTKSRLWIPSAWFYAKFANESRNQGYVKIWQITQVKWIQWKVTNADFWNKCCLPASVLVGWRSDDFSWLLHCWMFNSKGNTDPPMTEVCKNVLVDLLIGSAEDCVDQTSKKNQKNKTILS